MQLQGHTALVTGGATGIGLAIAERFLEAKSNVIICGRRESALREAQAKYPALHIRICDLTDEAQRARLVDWAIKEHPSLDVLVNNAGIQQWLDLKQAVEWARVHQEITSNFEAPVHLALLLLPHLRLQMRPTIINVTSGLAFAPLARTPFYNATKAAMHSFTISLRLQLADTPIRVIELVPPALNTDLGGPGLHDWAMPVKEFIDAAFAKLQTDEDREISYGFSAEASHASHDDLDAIIKRLNTPH